MAVPHSMLRESGLDVAQNLVVYTELIVLEFGRESACTSFASFAVPVPNILVFHGTVTVLSFYNIPTRPYLVRSTTCA